MAKYLITYLNSTLSCSEDSILVSHCTASVSVPSDFMFMVDELGLGRRLA
jgi:hypothetical protein